MIVAGFYHDENNDNKGGRSTNQVPIKFMSIITVGEHKTTYDHVISCKVVRDSKKIGK